MTNKEMLTANLLDIIFEHRNKNYGAYALRKTYPQRLEWALGISLGICLVLLMINFISHQDNAAKHNEGTVLELIPLGQEPKEPEQPRQKHQEQTATVQATNNITLTRTETVMPTQEDFEGATPSTETHEGAPPTLDTTAATPNTGNSNTTTEPSQSEFHPRQKEAEFPGGKEAFAQFLRDRLNTPGELEPGQKQAVIVRFMVDVDGTISKTEIMQSGGSSFDREVIRVLKKMPKWIPAEQNEVKVPVYFTQVVTFIGQEE